jgi:hypothetical protein
MSKLTPIKTPDRWQIGVPRRGTFPERGDPFRVGVYMRDLPVLYRKSQAGTRAGGNPGIAGSIFSRAQPAWSKANRNIGRGARTKCSRRSNAICNCCRTRVSSLLSTVKPGGTRTVTSDDISSLCAACASRVVQSVAAYKTERISPCAVVVSGICGVASDLHLQNPIFVR